MEVDGGQHQLSSALADDRLADLGLFCEVHHQLTDALEHELERRCGLPLTWFEVLVHLGRAEDQRMTMTDLARQVAFTSGGITRLVDRMVDAGLVERANCPSDRRSVYVGLTDAGRLRLEDAVAIQLRGLEAHLVGPLTTAEREALRGILIKLRR